MAADLDPDSLRDTLNRVIAYRDLQRHVRSTAKNNFFWGAVLFVLWYASGRRLGPNDIVGYVQFGLAALEVLTGLLKLVRPSAECLLLDALIFFALAGSWLFRAVVLQMNGITDIFGFAVGAYMGYTAVGFVSAYSQLLKRFPERPTGQHVAYVNELLREIRTGDPDNDPSALEFGRGLSGKLLGELLIGADAGGGAFVVPREGVELQRVTPGPGDDRPPGGRLRVYGTEVASFPLTDATWRNYAKWKGV